MNKTILMGRITKDIEVKAAGKTNYTKFSVAVDRDKEHTDFISVTAFGKTAEALEKWSGKGKRVLVEGSIQTGSYTDKEGSKHFTTDVIANRVQIIDFKDGGKKEDDEEAPFPFF